MAFDLSDYKTVAERIADFKALYPQGSLRPADPAVPYRIEQIGDKTYVVVVAAAYRTPDDECPGVGMAWEPFPGATPYTKESELQNAETSAWGRAIVAALASESKSVASRDEVQNRDADRLERTANPERPKCVACGLPLTGKAKNTDKGYVHDPTCPEDPF